MTLLQTVLFIASLSTSSRMVHLVLFLISFLSRLPPPIQPSVMISKRLLCISRYLINRILQFLISSIIPLSLLTLSKIDFSTLLSPFYFHHSNLASNLESLPFLLLQLFQVSHFKNKIQLLSCLSQKIIEAQTFYR